MKYQVWLMRFPVCWHKGCSDIFPPASAQPLKMDSQNEEVVEEDLDAYAKRWEDMVSKINELGDKAVLIGQTDSDFIIKSFNPSQEQLGNSRFVGSNEQRKKEE